jgi:hypothetical protein
MHRFYSWLLQSIMIGSGNIGTRKTSGASDRSLVGFGVLVSFGTFVGLPLGSSVGVAVGCCVDPTGGGSAGTMGVKGVSVGVSVGVTLGGTGVGGTAVVGSRVGVSVKVCVGAGVTGVGVSVLVGCITGAFVWVGPTGGSVGQGVHVSVTIQGVADSVGVGVVVSVSVTVTECVGEIVNIKVKVKELDGSGVSGFTNTKSESGVTVGTGISKLLMKAWYCGSTSASDTLSVMISLTNKSFI